MQEERFPACELAYGYRRGPYCCSRPDCATCARLSYCNVASYCMRQAGRRKGQYARDIDTAYVRPSGHWRVWRRRRRRRRPRAARPRPRSRLRPSGCRPSQSLVWHTPKRRRRRRAWRAAPRRGITTIEAGRASLSWPPLQPAPEAPWLLVLGISLPLAGVVNAAAGRASLFRCHAQLRRRHLECAWLT